MSKNQADMTLDFLKERTDNLLIVGGGGTGKSTLIRKWLNYDDSIIPVTPTGIAAINLGCGCSTAHSAFAIPLSPNLYDHINHGAKLRLKRHKMDALAACSGILIDEISMIRGDVLDYIDYTMKIVRRNNEPFGGVRMVVVGDPFQLAPVVKARDGMTKKWFFESRVWKQLDLLQAELTEIHRQTDSDFKEVLARVRIGEHTHDDLDYLNQNIDKWNEDCIVLASTNSSVNNINERKLEELDGKKFYSRMIIQKKFDPKDVKASEHLELRVGARVVFVKNNYDTDGSPIWINGTAGVVKGFRDNLVEVQIDGGELVDVERATWEKVERRRVEGIWRDEIVGKCIQFPLKLGFASTIHSAQSLTLERLFFKNTNLFTAGQAYTALSRATGPQALTLQQRMAMRDIKVNQKVKDWYDKFVRT